MFECGIIIDIIQAPPPESVQSNEEAIVHVYLFLVNESMIAESPNSTPVRKNTVKI